MHPNVRDGSQIADACVVDDARRGDRDAITALWRIYQPQLLRFLRARRAPNPDDVASQVWIDVGRALPTFDGDGDAFRSWIFTIARRRSIDEARRLSRRAEDLVGDHVERWGSGDGLERGAPDPTDDIGALDRALELVARLSPDMADAVMLRVVFDLPVAHVAAVMDRTEGNVRVLVHRGLTKLNSLLTAAETVAPRTLVQTPTRRSCNNAALAIVRQA